MKVGGDRADRGMPSVGNGITQSRLHYSPRWSLASYKLRPTNPSRCVTLVWQFGGGAEGGSSAKVMLRKIMNWVSVFNVRAVGMDGRYLDLCQALDQQTETEKRKIG